MVDKENTFRSFWLLTSSMLSGITIPSGGEKGSGAFSLFTTATFCGGGFCGGGGLLVSYCCCF